MNETGASAKFTVPIPPLGTFARLSPPLSRHLLLAVLLPSMILGVGCVTAPYRYGRFHPDRPEGTDVQPIRVDRGRPNAALDGLGWVVGLPGRVLAMNKNVNSHHVSAATVERLEEYMELNDISDVYVSINDYDPADQWRRLRENRRIAPFWKYTAGSLTWLGSTLLPRRVIGGDKYNPFTNTLVLTSDVPALVIAQAAYAKDVRSRKHPGAYATLVNDLPISSVMRQVKATGDVLGYARDRQDWDAEQEAYHTLYPKIGSDLFSTGSHFVPVFGPLLSVAGAVAGHATGRTTAALRARQLQHTIDGSPAGNPTERQELAKRLGGWDVKSPSQKSSPVTPAAYKRTISRRIPLDFD